MWGLFVSARYQDFWNEEIVLHFSVAAPIIWVCIFHMTGGPSLCTVAGLGEALSRNSQGTIALCVTAVQNEGKRNSLVPKYKMLWNSPFNSNLDISSSSSRPGYSGLQWVTFSAVGQAGGWQRRARHVVYWLVLFLKALWEPTSSVGVLLNMPTWNTLTWGCFASLKDYPGAKLCSDETCLRAFQLVLTFVFQASCGFESAMST